MRYSACTVMLLAADAPVVPLLVKATYNAPAVNVSELGPSTPIPPINSSSARAVVVVVPEEGVVLEAVEVLDLSRVPIVARPLKSAAVTARAVTEGRVAGSVP